MLEEMLLNGLKPSVVQMVNDYLNEQGVTLRTVQVVVDGKVRHEVSGLFHKDFEKVLKLVEHDIPTMLVGPAGSGKNVCIKQVADTLGLEMYYTNNVSNEFKITGFVDAGGVYHETEFYKAFKNGGVFFLDEIDSSDPSALIILNSAISNGYVTFPHERVDRHPDFRCIAAANTWGNGRDFQYVGRNALDAASLDRFVSVRFDYDKGLERALYPNEEILEFVWDARKTAFRNQIRHIFSTRTIKYSYEMAAAGFDLDTIIQSVIIKGMNADDINTVIRNMDLDRYDNPYMSKLYDMVDRY
ncbi:MAG TPA: AAA family ATPase [Firmicutes bacterium]|nr:AAA family ATPase [Bacillota bacterium]